MLIKTRRNFYESQIGKFGKNWLKTVGSQSRIFKFILEATKTQIILLREHMGFV